jgi:hypothetical protein
MKQTPRQEAAAIYKQSLHFRIGKGRRLLEAAPYSYDHTVYMRDHEYHISEIIRLNSVWADTIINFIATNQQFSCYLQLAPSNRSGNTKVLDMKLTPNNILIWFVCHDNVATETGDRYFRLVNEGNTKKIPPSRLIPIEAIQKLPPITSEVDLKTFFVNPKPIGDDVKISKDNQVFSHSLLNRATLFVIQHAFNPDCLINFNNKHFREGLRTVYNGNRIPSEEEAVEFVKTWEGDPYVGYLLCLAITVGSIDI